MTFTREGYQPLELHVDATMDGGYLKSRLFGDVIGFLVVDPLPGVMWKLPPKVLATLRRQPLNPSSEADPRSRLWIRRQRRFVRK